MFGEAQRVKVPAVVTKNEKKNEKENNTHITKLDLKQEDKHHHHHVDKSLDQEEVKKDQQNDQAASDKVDKNQNEEQSDTHKELQNNLDITSSDNEQLEIENELVVEEKSIHSSEEDTENENSNETIEEENIIESQPLNENTSDENNDEHEVSEIIVDEEKKQNILENIEEDNSHSIVENNDVEDTFTEKDLNNEQNSNSIPPCAQENEIDNIIKKTNNIKDTLKSNDKIKEILADNDDNDEKISSPPLWKNISGRIYLFFLFLLRSMFQIHQSALNVLKKNHVAFTVTYIYAFPFIVSFLTDDSTSAPSIIWYSFLVWFFVNRGQPQSCSSPTSLNIRLLLPLLFVFEGG